ncbi:MAG: hypothetical protein ACI92G_001303, partial [Candidatus Pelagisphaera sp.]
MDGLFYASAWKVFGLWRRLSWCATSGGVYDRDC